MEISLGWINIHDFIEGQRNYISFGKMNFFLITTNNFEKNLNFSIFF